MDKCREEFEKIPYVKAILEGVHSSIVWFGEDKYHTSFVGFDGAVNRLNGAWFVFQHQQAKVEEQAQQIANLKSLIQGHELRHQQYKEDRQRKRKTIIDQRKELMEQEEEFAEDERFLKEQIKDKDLKISNLEYQQGMDKELIQTLQSKSEKLQKRVDAALKLISEKSGDIYLSECVILGRFVDAEQLEQALKGEG